MATYLVATDLSQRGDRAIERAVALARDAKARLVALHVMDEDLPEEVRTGMKQAARTRLEALVSGAEALECTIRVDEGDPSTDIHAVADEVGADLVILGIHRPRPLLDIFRETTLERLVRLGRQPVLVVRDPVAGSYAKVLAALDFSPASRRAIELAQSLAPGAELRGFHAVHLPFQGLTDSEGHAVDARFYIGAAQSDLAAWATREGMDKVAQATDIREGALHAVLAEAVRDFKPDLLALGAHGRTGKAPFLLGSFANDIMREGPCDLLIARG